jgi:hypothetical protein
MDNSLKSLAKHYLLGNAIYGGMLTEQQRKELVHKQAVNLAKKAKAKQELDAILNEPDDAPATAAQA